ncbi:metallophosphoesterase [Rhodoferax sp. WC2427]|uniref:metallophosphoesterase family protein n=1 Tax=Rhodoferax sp. WC2427 TaxID=3234144 RepID=UPI003467C386
MTVLLQISDPHFGTEQAPVVAALAALARQQQPDLLVLSGDITQRARSAQFRAARACMDRLGGPLLAVPGNHDIPLFNLWARWRHPYAGHCAAFGPVLEPVFRSADLLVVGVNTTRAYRHEDGEVSPAQIERVATLLAGATAAQLRVVVVHQPIAVQRAEDVKNLLRGHADAQRAWALAGADVVLGGHIHLPFVLPLPGLARPLWAVQAGTALSSRVRAGAPNSVNLLRWQAAERRCNVEQWDFAAASGAFACVKVTPIQVGRGLHAV